MTCLGRIGTKFLNLLPPLRSQYLIYCFTNDTPRFLRVHFLTPLRRSRYLVLLGVRPTVLGHKLEKYESSAKLSGRPPAVDIINILIAYRQLRTQKSKNTEIPTLLSWNFWNIWRLETFAKNLNFSHFRNIFLIRVQNLLSKAYQIIPSFAKRCRKEIQTAERYVLKLTNKLLLFKITNTGRVQLTR